MVVTALAPKIGNDNSAKIAKAAHKNGTTLKEEVLKTNLISEKEYEISSVRGQVRKQLYKA